MVSIYDLPLCFLSFWVLQRWTIVWSTENSFPRVFNEIHFTTVAITLLDGYNMQLHSKTRLWNWNFVLVKHKQLCSGWVAPTSIASVVLDNISNQRNIGLAYHLWEYVTLKTLQRYSMRIHKGLVLSKRWTKFIFTFIQHKILEDETC